MAWLLSCLRAWSVSAWAAGLVGRLLGAPGELEAGSQLGTGDLHGLDIGGIGVGGRVRDDRDAKSLGGEGDERPGV